jgi:hypothetical protein
VTDYLVPEEEGEKKQEQEGEDKDNKDYSRDRGRREEVKESPKL